MLETSFRIHRDKVHDQNADWLSTNGRTAKIGFDPIATERHLRRNGKWKRQRRNGFFLRIGFVILTELTEFLRNLCNGNGKTATAERQRNAGN